MIRVNRLNMEEFWINAEHIEFLEATPDTMVTLASGHKVIVSQSVEEVLDGIYAYKKRVSPQIRENRAFKVGEDD